VKKLIATTACALMTSLSPLAKADPAANLQIKISGTSQSNTYFLCLDGVGCVSMFAADHGKKYPLTPGQIERIFMVNRSNLRTYFQPLPASCNVTVNANQTLIVKGKVVHGANDNAHIDHLECSVA